ncbi:MAG TPA: SCO family protein [Verrucomicrobiota bacterium]|nr:SCO family protein [Verrucomicrobiales bacterium]HRI14889.1 SCO family protein [Verrucomicrobiota bacterium]
MISRVLIPIFSLISLWTFAADAPVRPPCCRSLPGGQPAESSLYQLESVWTSDVGTRTRLGVFRGRPQIVALFFTHCEYACPILVSELKRLEQALPADLRERVDFLLISFDSARDTPAQLADYRRVHELDLAHWSLLRGEVDDVRELAALLGVNYRADARGQFAHSNVITVLDAEGSIARQFTGLKLPVDDVIKVLSGPKKP